MSEIYKKNLVAYIDLLGFKDAALNQEKADEILKILKGFKSSEKNGSTSVEKTGQITNINRLYGDVIFRRTV
ncbi:MAG: hypothetical protein NTU49_03790 [Gammaproteobacteria bacterium]|nr:hypothetical protein [Gammaproteobacteria bacterium]